MLSLSTVGSYENKFYARISYLLGEGWARNEERFKFGGSVQLVRSALLDTVRMTASKFTGLY